MLQKIRAALQHRDAGYQVGAGVIELDAGTFGRREAGNQCDVLVAIETKAWVNAKGQARSRAGFAKVWWARKPRLTPNSWWTPGCERGPWSIPTAVGVSEM
jgi:5-deoxy-D-glucuronate isomerase